MAHIKLNLSRLSLAEKIAKSWQIVAALTGKASFPTSTPVLMKKLLILSILAGLVSLSQPANASTKAWYVTVTDVKVRSASNSYVLGRLYKDQRMDIQDINEHGWAYGWAYGYVNRCVWVQFRVPGNSYFRTNGTIVSTKCPTENRELALRTFTNLEIWGDFDGELHTLSQETDMWDNWSWGHRWGNANHRGKAPKGGVMKIRYTTDDGVGVMARRCSRDAGGKITCYPDDWIFILRGSVGPRI